MPTAHRLALNYVDAQEALPPADVVIFAVKFSGLPQAIEAARQQVGEHTLILSALNGHRQRRTAQRCLWPGQGALLRGAGHGAVKVGNHLTYSHPRLHPHR